MAQSRSKKTILIIKKYRLIPPLDIPNRKRAGNLMQRSCSSFMLRITWPLTPQATSLQYIIFCKICKTRMFYCQCLVVYVKYFAAVTSICMDLLASELLLFFQNLHRLVWLSQVSLPSVALYSSQLTFQSQSWDCSWSLGRLGVSLGSSRCSEDMKGDVLS